MKYRQWRMGLFVSALSSALVALVADSLAPHIPWWKLMMFALGNAGKDMALFMKQHPIENVSFDTTHLLNRDVPIIKEKDIK